MYEVWHNKLPEAITDRMATPFVESKDIPYNMLDRDSVKSYGHEYILYSYDI